MILDFQHSSQVRRSVLADVYSLGDRLRPDDLREVRAALYKDGADALLNGFQQSDECFTIAAPDTGAPIAMFGLIPSQQTLYVPVWLLGSTEIEQFWLKFARVSKRCLDTLTEQFGAIGNYVDVRNTLHIRWLEWNGFAHYHTTPSLDGSTTLKLYIKEIKE
jgi:hypothetical protein